MEVWLSRYLHEEALLHRAGDRLEDAIELDIVGLFADAETAFETAKQACETELREIPDNEKLRITWTCSRVVLPSTKYPPLYEWKGTDEKKNLVAMISVERHRVR